LTVPDNGHDHVMGNVEVELRRVVDRLNNLPLAKVEALLPRCHDVASLIVEQTRMLDGSIPTGADLPSVGASAAGAQLAVVGLDYISAASSHDDHSAQPVLESLTELRRILP
jgi:hypothetical protein